MPSPAPELPKNLHFVGIGGVGMAALAVLAKARGAAVSGCDAHASARTRWLESQGIRVFEGHSPSHLDGVDLVVATPAVGRANAELLAAPATVSRGEMLAGVVSSRESIAVCGSHGKTTTATFVARLLSALGEDVSWAIGGETGDFPVAGVCDGFADGRGVLVVEADESDGTLALYHATTLVVTNCEYDHPDHFRTFDDYKACFDAARRNAGDVVESEALSDEGLSAALLDAMRGLAPHNRKNARAAVEVALRRGHGQDATAAALPDVVSALPDRRFQLVWPAVAHRPPACQAAQPLVYTDYAHHPTEMKCAVAMARQACGGKLRVLFQPHRYSRTKALLGDFPAAFEGADEVVLCPTYAAFEQPVEGGDVADLYLSCRRAFSGAAAPRLMLARSCEEAWRHAFLETGPGDVTLLLGAGDIVGLVPRVVADMEGAAKSGSWNRTAGAQPLSRHSFFCTGGRTVGGGVRRVVGMGSNLWISDLTTDEEYVRAGDATVSGRVFGADAPGAATGIPWMAGIPGTVGGWTKMNAGAFGHSFSEAVARVKADGRWIGRDECGFGYRTSAIEGVIEAVELREDVDGDGHDAGHYLAMRRKFPPRCCGSVFRNPPGDFAGRLLEAAGAKGLSVGGASVWDGHANVIVAGEGATSSDILALARIMRGRVRHAFGVDLAPEISGLATRD